MDMFEENQMKESFQYLTTEKRQKPQFCNAFNIWFCTTLPELEQSMEEDKFILILIPWKTNWKKCLNFGENLILEEGLRTQQNSNSFAGFK